MSSNGEVPVYRRGWFVALLVIGGLFLILYFSFLARDILTPFAISFAIAYILDPLVDRMERWKLSRLAAVIILILILVLFLLVLGLTVIPGIWEEAVTAGKKIPGYIDATRDWMLPKLQLLKERYPDYYETLASKFRGEEITELIADREKYQWLLDPINTFIKKMFSSILNLVLGILHVIVIPIFTFYLLLDIDKITAKIKEGIPPRFKETILARAREIDAALSNFVRGQVWVACILACIYCVGLSIAGVPFAILIGVVAGLANIVPYLGIVLGVLPACLFVFLEHQSLWRVVAVILIFSGAQMLEGFYITPKVVGTKVGMNPVLVLLAVLIGGNFFGFLGMILAVPFTAAGLVLVKAGYAGYLDSDFYRKEKPPAGTDDRPPKKRRRRKRRPDKKSRDASPSGRESVISREPPPR